MHSAILEQLRHNSVSNCCSHLALNVISHDWKTCIFKLLRPHWIRCNEDWKRADSFYEIAAGLTTKPAGVYNNWGFSKLTRGDFTGAEKKFWEALRHDPNLFTAKNNLVLARGAQRNYELPVIRMSQVERAQLLYTLALAAVKQGDVTMAKTLLREAIDTHPQHFEAAVRSLQALEENVSN